MMKPVSSHRLVDWAFDPVHYALLYFEHSELQLRGHMDFEEPSTDVNERKT
jgi:hypothetical protein